jgi:hypothetical protein
MRAPLIVLRTNPEIVVPNDRRATSVIGTLGMEVIDVCTIFRQIIQSIFTISLI